MWAVFFISFLILFTLAYAAIRFYLVGEDLRQYDSENPKVTFYREQPSAGFASALETVSQMDKPINVFGLKKFISELRTNVDKLGDFEYTCAIVPVLTQHNDNPIQGEWVLAENADPNKRLLYIHGGAFLFGSPKSHRAITERLSRELGVAVFSLNYSKLPERTRRQGIIDCRQAYLWLLENGPEKSALAQRIYIAGDSAGGNLTLMLLGWLKTQPYRQADAAIAFSPTIDNSFSFASIAKNVSSDVILKPLLGHLHKVPLTLRVLLIYIISRMRPNDPQVSPIFANLSNLPPTLIQASDCEMLLDDSYRYTNKALAEGSFVRMQTWSNMLHVWQLFALDESDEAFQQIVEFINEIEAGIKE